MGKNMRKNTRKNSRKSSRKNYRKNGGTRRSRGILSTVYSPVNRLVGTAEGMVESGLNTIVDVPFLAVSGAKNTVK